MMTDYCPIKAERAFRSLPGPPGISVNHVRAVQKKSARGVVDTLTRIVDALDAAGIELIGNKQPSQGRGRGVRLKEPS